MVATIKATVICNQGPQTLDLLTGYTGWELEGSMHYHSLLATE